MNKPKCILNINGAILFIDYLFYEGTSGYILQVTFRTDTYRDVVAEETIESHLRENFEAVMAGEVTTDDRGIDHDGYEIRVLGITFVELLQSFSEKDEIIEYPSEAYAEKASVSA